jgi:hypothetical protein
MEMENRIPREGKPKLFLLDKHRPITWGAASDPPHEEVVGGVLTSRQLPASAVGEVLVAVAAGDDEDGALAGAYKNKKRPTVIPFKG